MSLTATIRCSISADYERTVGGRQIVDDIPPTKDYQFGSGTGAGLADIAFSDHRTLASATSENLDMSGGLTDAFGQTIVALKVKAIEVHADETNTTNITVGAAASNTFVGPFNDATDAIVVKPGGRFVIADPVGWTVTPATADILKVTNSAGAAGSYRIKIIAATA